MSVATVKLTDIRENPVALRQVNKKSEGYMNLVESIKEVGLLNPISVRPVDGQDGMYSLIDGLHRFSACMDAGLETIPVNITPMEDARALEAQIIGNIHKIETTPVQYSQQLQRILAMNPTLTQNQLAQKLSKSPAWIDDRLSLNKLHESIKSLVDSGQVNLTNAYALAKLPLEEQPNWLDRAITTTPKEFVPAVQERKKEIDKARRQGRSAEPAQFTPTAFVRKLSELKTELETGEVGAELTKGMKKAADGFALAVKWCLNLDEGTVAAAKVEYEVRQKAIKEKQEKAKTERAAKKAERAGILAARLKVESETLNEGGDVAAALASFDKANGLVDGKFPVETPASK